MLFQPIGGVGAQSWKSAAERVAAAASVTPARESVWIVDFMVFVSGICLLKDFVLYKIYHRDPFVPYDF